MANSYVSSLGFKFIKAELKNENQCQFNKTRYDPRT